jgi:tetratricopeptide (TPR) repeat protein
MRNLSASIAVMLAVSAGSAQADALTDQARVMLDKGDAKAAYALLEPLQAQRAGDADYDFLLGLSALDSGKNTNAVFALERVIAVNPNHVRARAELARAYAALGETQTAKQEFETVKKQGIPPEVVATIDKFLSAIERIDEQGRTVWRGFTELALGHDSNINAARSSNEIAIPFFGGLIFPLGQTQVRQPSNFYNLSAGASVRHPINPELALNAGLSGNWRLNLRRSDEFDASQFDTSELNGNVGLALTRGKDVYSGIFQANTNYVGDVLYRNTYGVTGQWQHNYDPRNQATGYIQASRIDYPNQVNRNIFRGVIGAAYGHALAGFKTVFYGGGYLGLERDRDDAPYLANNLWGLRAGLQHELAAKWQLLANASYENRHYRDDDPLFLKHRRDDLYNVSVALQYKVLRELTLSPQYAYTRNNSNIGTSDYTRHVVSVSLRHDF